MPLTVGTHSGTFHADDVLAFALIRHFVDADATVVRTRDKARLDACDIVIDVGGDFEPERLRFDHHQNSYGGDRSSAGMVLDWLETSGRVDAGAAATLRERAVNYVDRVDIGKEAPRLDVPCFARIVEALGAGHPDATALDAAFLQAAGVGGLLVEGLLRGHAAICEAKNGVLAAMKAAVDDGRQVIFLDRYLPWKSTYFEHGGAEHPTAFLLHPGDDGTWRIVAIPPTPGCFGQKVSLPESWAGLMGDDLEAVTGIPGSVFCHKNRFIAVFRTRDGAIEALKRSGLYAAT